MDVIVRLLLSVFLGGVAVLITARLVSGIELRGGLGSAMLVGLVYGLFKALLQVVLIIVTLPLVVLTLGLFILVINAFLLWLTDKVMTSFEVRSTRALFLGALLLSVLDLAFQLAVRGGAPF
jgi:putative membrane protein